MPRKSGKSADNRQSGITIEKSKFTSPKLAIYKADLLIKSMTSGIIINLDKIILMAPPTNPTRGSKIRLLAISTTPEARFIQGKKFTFLE